MKKILVALALLLSLPLYAGPKIKIAPLDWRSSQELIDSQITAANNFMSTRTFVAVIADNEWGILGFNTGSEGSPIKFKIFNVSAEIAANGVAATETLIENFLSSKTFVGWQDLEGGGILIWYR